MGVVRMNITLPEDVVNILKKKTKSGEKSSFIAEAIRSYSKKESQEELIKKLIAEYSSYESSSEDEEWLNADLGESHE
ncbi:MAG: hypothetical protein NDI63_06690 [Pseudobdellovibrio sp.]|nr:hypothetical protein [Pseudobdellovibrio sp.]